jgi:hypothetical protein
VLRHSSQNWERHWIHYTTNIVVYQTTRRHILENRNADTDYREKLKSHTLISSQLPLRIRDSAVGIATGSGMDDRGVGVWVPVGARFSPLQVVQTGSGAHQDSYPMGTGGLLLRG